jgi:HAD superfamily hydrolase (TIGR01549 family)
VPLETLFLDAGGVLVFPNWSRVSDTLRRHGVDADAEALRAAEPYAKRTIDEGTHIRSTTDAQRAWLYMDLVFERAGIKPSAAVDAAVRELAAYHAEHNLWEHVGEDVIPALERMRAAVPTLVVVSNANGVLQRLFDRMGLTRYFDVICDSCVEKVEKPDPRYFRLALERSGSRAESTTMVGDLYHVDVVGARNAGLDAILLDPSGLYADADCERVPTLAALADVVERRAKAGRPEGRPLQR